MNNQNQEDNSKPNTRLISWKLEKITKNLNCGKLLNPQSTDENRNKKW